MPTRRNTATSSELVARVRKGLEMFEAGACTAAQLAAGMRKLAEELERSEGAAGKHAVDVKLVFDKWVVEMGRDPQRTKLTGDRHAKILARLREGYSRDELIVAVMNVAQSAFHRGDNERQTAYDDITLICRDGAHLERFRDMGPERMPDTGTQPALPLLPAAPRSATLERRYKDTGW